MSGCGTASACSRCPFDLAVADASHPATAVLQAWWNSRRQKIRGVVRSGRRDVIGLGGSHAQLLSQCWVDTAGGEIPIARVRVAARCLMPSLDASCLNRPRTSAHQVCRAR